MHLGSQTWYDNIRKNARVGGRAVSLPLFRARAARSTPQTTKRVHTSLSVSMLVRLTRPLITMSNHRRVNRKVQGATGGGEGYIRIRAKADIRLRTDKATTGIASIILSRATVNGCSSEHRGTAYVAARGPACR